MYIYVLSQVNTFEHNPNPTSIYVSNNVKFSFSDKLLFCLCIIKFAPEANQRWAESVCGQGVGIIYIRCSLSKLNWRDWKKHTNYNLIIVDRTDLIYLRFCLKFLKLAWIIIPLNIFPCLSKSLLFLHNSNTWWKRHNSARIIWVISFSTNTNEPTDVKTHLQISYWKHIQSFKHK